MPPYLFVYALFVLLAGLRFRVGGDSLAYENYFLMLPNFVDLSSFDFNSAEYQPLWYIFNGIVKYINDSFVAFQLVHAILINGVVFWFLKRFSDNKWLAVLFYFVLYYLYFNMEILRESIAISIFLLSVPFLLKKNWLIYYSLCFIAFNFHVSAAVTFLFPFLLIDFKIWQYVSIYAILFVLFFFLSPRDLLSNFEVSGALSSKVDTYASIKVTAYGFLMQLLRLVPIFAILYIRKKHHFHDHQLTRLVNIYIVLGILGCFIGGFYRFQNYLAIVALVYIVDSIIIFSKNRLLYQSSYIKVCAMVFLLFFNQLVYYVKDTSQYQINTRFYNRYFPYHSIIYPKVEEDRERLFFNSMDIN